MTTDKGINLDKEDEKTNATWSRRSTRELTKSGSWGVYRGGSGGGSSKEREEWPAVDLRLSDFFSVWVILRHQNIPPPLLLYSLSLSLSLFLSLLIPLFCSIHFTLVPSHPIDARFIGVHDHHSQVLKPLRPG